MAMHEILTHRVVAASQLPWLTFGEHVRVVAVEGAVEDWAAYAGRVDASLEEIAMHGAKLPADVARQLFPMLKPKAYRH